MSEHSIRLNTCVAEIDEGVSLDYIKKAEPLFFKTPHGKRETYTVYRGFLIVRNTVQLTGRKPERRTSVYLFDIVDEATFYISTGLNLRSIAHAKNFIDRVIEKGTIQVDDI